ncbi:MAG TPA: VOC family protein [Egibacteraceae bacterium]|nr:VOC family protein [Egibacteraceae bacterium]
MPAITGVHHLSLTVSDLPRSVDWYTEVLGFAVHSEVEEATFRRTRLRHPASGVVVTLTRHDGGAAEAFDERRTGLDHVAFQVATLDEVDAVKRRFEELGVVHSEVRRGSGDVAIVTVRDPDNIQLEVMAVSG